MKRFLMQNIYWIWSHAAAVVMALMLVIDPGTRKVLTSYSGYTAVGFLVATLLLSPLKTLRPQWMFITKLNRHRRELGVAAFSYAVIHIACFIIKRGGFMNALPYVLHPALLSVIFISIPIFLLLALTSNQYSVKRMGFPKWKRLHKKVYWAEGGIIIHMILTGQALWAGFIFIPCVILQVVSARRKKSKV